MSAFSPISTDRKISARRVTPHRGLAPRPVAALRGVGCLSPHRAFLFTFSSPWLASPGACRSFGSGLSLP